MSIKIEIRRNKKLKMYYYYYRIQLVVFWCKEWLYLHTATDWFSSVGRHTLPACTAESPGTYWLILTHKHKVWIRKWEVCVSVSDSRWWPLTSHWERSTLFIMTMSVSTGMHTRSIFEAAGQRSHGFFFFFRFHLFWMYLLSLFTHLFI